MVYIICFIMTIVTTWIYEHSVQFKNKGIINRFFIIIIIFLPALLSGMRGISVGTDTETYRIIFERANQSGLGELLSANKAANESIEEGFLVYVWIISRLTDNAGIFQYINTFLTLIVFLNGAIYFRKKHRCSLTLMMSLYLFLYYCAFLNYGRQGLAISIIFFAVRYIEEKDFKRFIILLFIAIAIHISSIIILPVYFIFAYKEKFKAWQMIIIVIALLFLIVAGPQVIAWILFTMANLGLRSSTLLKYANHFTWVSRYDVNISQILMSLPQLLLFTLGYKYIKKESEFSKQYYIVSVMHFVLTVIGSVDANFNRLSFFFGIFDIILFATWFKGKKDEGKGSIYAIGLGLYCIGYFVLFTILNYYYFTLPVYPYTVSF